MIWLVVILWFLGGVVMCAWYNADLDRDTTIRPTRLSLAIAGVTFFLVAWPLVAIGFVGVYAMVSLRALGRKVVG